MKLVIITPVRDEAEYIEFTINSILSQTLLPVKWVIVNDGSRDNTDKIVKAYSKKARFIEYLGLPDRGYRKPGAGVVEAFYAGFKKVENLNYQILSKMDGDLEFAPDTLEEICKAFTNDPMLGIAGGPRYERVTKDSILKEVLVPKGFVGGPFKFYRKECFRDIGGLIHRAGWDGVDIIKANMHGWKTYEIGSIKIFHLRPTGTADGEGLSKACKKYGDISYYMGGYIWYFTLRVIGRSLLNRNLKIGYYMIKGYLESRRKNAPRESNQFRKSLRQIQIKNTFYWATLACKRFYEFLNFSRLLGKNSQQ